MQREVQDIYTKVEEMLDFLERLLSPNSTPIRRIFLSMSWYPQRKRVIQLSDAVDQQKANLSMMLQFDQAERQERSQREIMAEQHALQHQQSELIRLLMAQGISQPR